MSLESWLLFCATETVLCFTPGPAVLLVVSLSLTHGASAGFRASLGILAANAMYFVISATSLGALLLASWELFTIIKWCGAVYLIWRGFRMVTAAKPLADVGGTEPAPAGGIARFGFFPYGFLTQGANPKALVFFAAILPQFIDPRIPVGTQLAILGVSSITIELFVLGLYAIACHHTSGWARHSRLAVPLERLGGVFLVAAGARLALTDRS